MGIGESEEGGFARRIIINRASSRGVSWFLWRVVAAPQIPDGLHTVRHLWSFVDLLEAHHFLDAVRDLSDLD